MIDILGADDVRDSWFTEANTQDDDSKAEKHQEFEELVRINRLATESAELGRHEDAWNILVHARILDLAVGCQRHAPARILTEEEEAAVSPSPFVSFEPVSFATIAIDCVPRISTASRSLRRLVQQEGSPQVPSSAEDDASVLACSISENSVSSQRLSDGGLGTNSPALSP